ncbi:MAG: hypothetical protein QM764_02850 [Chitinophagaceae bacterium]
MLSIKSFAAICSVLLLSGCATIISGTKYPLHIRTDPKDARISVTNRKGKTIFEGKSPAEIKVRSGAGYFVPAKYYVKLSSPGFSERTVEVDFKFNGWYVGNLLIGGGIGMIIVDPLTGGMWKIKDPVVDEKLEPTNSTSLNIVNINDVPKDQVKSLVKIE